MAQTVQFTLSTLLGILGWNGAFLLLLIIAFEEFFDRATFACPCDWNVAYGTLMFLFPAISTFMLAFFTYFRQDNDSVPWKALRNYYAKKIACNFYDDSTDWDLHAGRCVRCKLRQKDWSLVKMAVSVILSLLYPLVWLSLSFLQATYYTCANIGPSPDGILDYCDFQIADMDDYRKALALAANRSQIIGGMMFVVTLFLLAVFIILYGEVVNYLKKVDLTPTSGGALQITVSALPSRSSGTVESTSHQDTVSVTSVQPLNQQPPVDGNKAIHVNLNSEFAAVLQGFFTDGSWGAVNINCSQEQERRSSSLRESYVPSQGALHQRQPIQSYESLHQVPP